MIGGHHDGIASLLRELPPTVRDSFAGSFTADPHTLTPARIRELAGPVIDGWVARRERELAGEILGGLAAAGCTPRWPRSTRARSATCRWPART